jgi:hypothetical protein
MASPVADSKGGGLQVSTRCVRIFVFLSPSRASATSSLGDSEASRFRPANRRFGP